MALPLEESAPNDFDFIMGDWVVKHRRLNERLAGCSTWTEFSGCSSTRKILGGFGNLEDNILHFPRSGDGPRWEQAFSADQGASWETNWTMQFAPAESDA